MSTLKIGVIGAGRIGKVHTETIARSVPQASVVAIADVNLEAAKELGRRMNVPTVSDDYRKVINHPEVDAVIICSPTDAHAKHTMETAQAGKHVFCEKPIALDLDTIQEVNRTVERCGVKFMVGFNRRFDANFKKVKQMVAERKVGDLHIVKITSRDPAPPPAEYVAVSGGMFLDMTIHDFDMARFIVGRDVDEVYAVGGVMVDPAIGKAGDIDTAVITLVFEGGTLGIIDNSRKAVYGYDQRLEVFGSGGMVKVDNNAPDTHDYYGPDGVHSSLPLNFFMDRYIEAYANEIKEFCEAVGENKPVSVGGRDGLLSVAIGLAAKRSLAEHRPVKVAEVLEGRK
jgi:myo-inositol 2-dehydrogenase / D-chiro-inositol 1-dehydrogenase